MHSGSCGDRISMWFGEREVNRSDGSIFLDKDWAFERPPITRFYAMLFWSRFCMFTWDDRPVVHTATATPARRPAQYSFSYVTCRSAFYRFLPPCAFVLLPLPPPILTKCCCIKTSLPRMKCSLMHSPCLSSVVLFAATSLLMSLYSKLVDNIAYEVDCAMITVKEGADVDIGLPFLFCFISSA